ncbi:hypothetical protein Z949_4046 [Sulfitobacter guttiformis KCTC 32187]|nr:hypothetical protein Z949_4046 [Sulfitobacter guttiformis KCTC 32187]
MQGKSAESMKFSAHCDFPEAAPPKINVPRGNIFRNLM